MAKKIWKLTNILNGSQPNQQVTYSNGLHSVVIRQGVGSFEVLHHSCSMMVAIDVLCWYQAALLDGVGLPQTLSA